MLRLARDVGGVVDAVEVDRLAVVVLPFTVGRRRQADHRCGRGPHVHVRHHFVEDLPGRNPARRPHDARHPEGAFEARALLAAERIGAGVGPRVLPGAVVRRVDDDGVGRLGADGVHDPADVGVHLDHLVGVVAEARLAHERLVRAGRLVHAHEVHAHEERLAVLGVLLDVGDRRIRLADVEIGQVLQRDHGAAVALDRRLARRAFPFIPVHRLLVHVPVFLVVFREEWVRIGRRVFIAIDTRVVGGELLHLVEAVH